MSEPGKKVEASWETQARERHESALKVDASAIVANEALTATYLASAKREDGLRVADAAQAVWFAKDIELREAWNAAHLRSVALHERHVIAAEKEVAALERIAAALEKGK